MNEFVPVAYSPSVTTMTGAFWEMQRRQILGNKAWEIEVYAALEHPQESVATVLQIVDNHPKPKGWRPRRLGSRESPTSAVAAPSEV